MRILILSDIHANLEALEACLAAAPEHDCVYNLGDIVGYGANPNEVTERSRRLGTVFVRGNHDRACTGLTPLTDFNPIAALAAMWTQQNLTPENLTFLKQLPHGPIAPFDGLRCVHGSPRDEDEYVLMRREAFNILAHVDAPLTFFGHTHVQGGYWIDDEQDTEGGIEMRYPEGPGPQRMELQLESTGKYLINPGSVGQPRDGDPRAAFASYDTEKILVTYFRVPYDIAGAQKKIFAAGLPERLGVRLEEGR
ncbi:MAG TPA: metallophosphoesterase family protein [Candidatus Limnocylindrales bacterium]|nr:metallophosphoesterase family protein [Candidatus Limnocylindrales bacterium]